MTEGARPRAINPDTIRYRAVDQTTQFRQAASDGVSPIGRTAILAYDNSVPPVPHVLLGSQEQLTDFHEHRKDVYQDKGIPMVDIFRWNPYFPHPKDVLGVDSLKDMPAVREAIQDGEQLIAGPFVVAGQQGETPRLVADTFGLWGPVANVFKDEWRIAESSENLGLPNPVSPIAPNLENLRHQEDTHFNFTS